MPESMDFKFLIDGFKFVYINGKCIIQNVIPNFMANTSSTDE